MWKIMNGVAIMQIRQITKPITATMIGATKALYKLGYSLSSVE
jgi:hypothetical protein